MELSAYPSGGGSTFPESVVFLQAIYHHTPKDSNLYIYYYEISILTSAKTKTLHNEGYYSIQKTKM
jgi:hypothetical protein